MNQNGGIHKGGFAVLCHRNGGSESPGILSLKEAGGKSLACKSCPDRLRSVDEVAKQTKVQ